MKKRMSKVLISILIFVFFFGTICYAAPMNIKGPVENQFENQGIEIESSRNFNNIIGIAITLIQVIGLGIGSIIIIYAVLSLIILKVKFNNLDPNDEDYAEKQDKLGMKYFKAKKRLLIFAILSFVLIVASGTLGIIKTFKPIIYIYPKEDNTEVSVTLSNPEKITCSYPKYNEGWNVVVDEDGTIKKEGREYYALYWEGLISAKEFKDGFVVKGEDTAKFLEEKLKVLGLTDREAEEFIVYWLPKMENNNYNLIRFLEEDELNEEMELNISPKPDTLIRIQMQYKPLLFNMNIQEQELTETERSGYTVVEWGGSKV